MPNRSKKTKDKFIKIDDSYAKTAVLHYIRRMRHESEQGVDFTPVVGCEQGGVRPALIIQNDIGNRYSPTVIAAAITSRMGKNRLPTHVALDDIEIGLRKNSFVMLEQVRTIDRSRLHTYLGHISDMCLQQVDRALGVSLGFCKQQSEIKEEQYETSMALLSH